MIIVEDAIYANAPHIKMLSQNNMRYIIGVKPKSHKFLFDYINHAKKEKIEEIDINGTKMVYEFTNNVPFNDTNDDVMVNFLEFWDYRF